MEDATEPMDDDEASRISEVGAVSVRRSASARTPAFDRLERALGREFAQRLVCALAGPRAS
jgi:hypothetical protein